MLFAHLFTHSFIRTVELLLLSKADLPQEFASQWVIERLQETAESCSFFFRPQPWRAEEL